MSARESDSSSESNGEPGSGSAAADALRRVRTEPRAHAVAVVGAVAIGLVLAWLHWFGLVVGGALVGLISASLPRALLGAIGFGLVVLVAFAVAVGGSVGAVSEMTPVVYLVVASAIGLPVLGSLVRGLL